MEEPKIDNILLLADEKGLDFKAENTSFYLGRVTVSISDDPQMTRWRSRLFVFMSRIAADAASFFDIPKDQAIEVGVQLQL